MHHNTAFPPHGLELGLAVATPESESTSLFSEYASLSLVKKSGLLDRDLTRAVDGTLEELRAELERMAEAYVELANNGMPLGSVFPRARLLSVYEDLRDKPLAEVLDVLADALERGDAGLRDVLLGPSGQDAGPSQRTDVLRSAAERLRHGAVVSLKNPGQEFLADAADELAALREEFADLFAESDSDFGGPASSVVNIAPMPAYFGDGALTELLDEMQEMEERLERLGFIRFDAIHERWLVLDGRP